MEMLKNVFKSRTIWFAILLAALSIVQGYTGLLPMTPAHQMLVGIAIAIIVTILRCITTQPIT